LQIDFAGNAHNPRREYTFRLRDIVHAANAGERVVKRFSDKTTVVHAVRRGTEE
jgi:hypothetical protein